MKYSFIKTNYFIFTIVLVLCWGCNPGTVTDDSSEHKERSRVDGTTGTPIGGVGTGAVKYCAWTGILNAFTDMTPAGMQRYNKHVSLGNDASFQFFSDREGNIISKDTLKVIQVNGRYDDDAIFPVHRASYGSINEVSINMTGFCPWDPADFNRMCVPYAFYEFTLSNNVSTTVDVAIALKIKYDQHPVIVEGKGLADDHSMHKRAVFVKCDDADAQITAGADEDFFKKGICNNSIIDLKNRVAIKVRLEAKEVKNVKFVLSWYKVNSYGKYFYENMFEDASSVAESGLIYFDSFRENATGFVDKMRGSNLPQWMVDYLLNTLCNMTNNSVYAKDGRACMAEGEFDILGTIDEYWQGRSIIGSNLMPEFTWKELEFWGRTQFREPYHGQIHHDFGVNGMGTSDADLCAWDDHSHADYRPVKDIVSWPDENVGFIIGVYETFIATNDIDKLTLLWPYVKNTGNRLIAQKNEYGDPEYPWIFKTSHNMYDAGGYSQTYSTGTVIPAYKCMALMAREMNEPETEQFYNDAALETYRGFEEKYLSVEYQYIDKHCEGALAGPWFSQCLKFDQFDQTKVDQYIYNVLDRYYNPLQDSMGFPDGTYNEWPQHLVGHFGGYGLQRGHYDALIAVWKDMYNRGYLDRNRVFNLSITLRAKANPDYAATSIDGYYQYTSRTSTWRIYQDMIGYYRNRNSKEIWLEPMILPEMDHELTDGYFISAEGNGTISCMEKGVGFQDRKIVFKPDNPTKVKGIYIKNHSGMPAITVNGVTQSWSRTGPDWKKRIKINWDGEVGKDGIVIDVTEAAI